MERINERHYSRIVLLLTIFFFVGVVAIQYWLEPLSDFPRKDEYQSVLSALNLPVYTPNLYVWFLKLWTGMFPDFFSLWRFNFFASHLSLAIIFFLYHYKRGIAFSTNFFVTALLVLSTINIALTRKMHFWAAVFFFLLIFLADFINPKKRLFFLTIALFLLGFFRVEFFFSAIVAAAMIAHEWLKKKFSSKNSKVILTGLLLLLFFLVLSGILIFGYGMKALLIESLQLNQKGIFFAPVSFMQLLFQNVIYHSYYSLYALIVPLRIYFPGLALSFGVLLFLKRSFKNNWILLKQNLRKDFLPFYVPALMALYSIRFTDFYLIMTFVFILSALSFLLNTEDKLNANLIVSVLILPAFFILRPELNGSAYINFPTFKREVRIHRHMFDLIQHLKVAGVHPPYKILIDQYVTGVLPDEGREYFMFSDLSRLCQGGPVTFDLVLIPGNWTLPPEQPWIEKCVWPRLSMSRHEKPSPGYDLYIGPRILKETGAEKMPVK